MINIFLPIYYVKVYKKLDELIDQGFAKDEEIDELIDQVFTDEEIDELMDQGFTDEEIFELLDQEFTDVERGELLDEECPVPDDLIKRIREATEKAWHSRGSKELSDTGPHNTNEFFFREKALSDVVMRAFLTPEQMRGEAEIDIEDVVRRMKNKVQEILGLISAYVQEDDEAGAPIWFVPIKK